MGTTVNVAITGLVTGLGLLIAAPALAQTTPAESLGQPTRSLQTEDFSVGGERPVLTPDYSAAPTESYWSGWVYSESLPLSSTSLQSGPFVPGNHCAAPRRINLVCSDFEDLQ
ncbi:MAG: hypothetical protein AAFU71_01555 [Cyanobacteria bacterium J06632_22]